VVLVKFPFSDLSGAKVRPALVLASAGNDDWLLLQITSNPYSDTQAIEIDDTSFVTGGLQRTSYVRPGKIFTANSSIIQRSVGQVDQKVTKKAIDSVTALVQGLSS